MKIKYFIVWMIIFFCFSYAAADYTIDSYTYTDTIYINTSTTFPYVATQNNTVYVLTEDVTAALSSNGAIYFNDCDSCALVSEHGERNAINLSTDFALDGDRFGVYVNSASYMFKMDSIEILPTWNVTDTFENSGSSSNAPHMLRLEDCQEAGIYRSVIKVWGFAAGTDWSLGGVNAIRISNGYRNQILDDSLYNLCVGWNARWTYPCPVVMIYTRYADTYLSVGSRSDYTARVANSYVENSWAGIQTYSQSGIAGVVVLDTNYIVPKATQTSTTHPTYPHGDGAAITLQGQHKVFVSGNIVRPVVNAAASPPIRGGYGMFMSGIYNDGLSASPRSLVDHNDMYGVLDTSSDHAYGLFTKWQLQNIDFEDNIWRASATSNSNAVVNAAWLSNHGDCTFSRNIYECITVSGIIGAALRLRGMDTTYLGSITFTDEQFFSNDHIIYYQPDSPSGVDTNASGDTIFYWAKGIHGVHTFSSSFNRIDTASNMSASYALTRLASPWLITNTDFTNIRAFDGIDETDMVWAGGSASELEWFTDLELIAVDSVGTDLNAQVVIINGYNDTIYNGNVGPDGIDSVNSKYYRTTGNAASDSTAFNTFKGFAVYPGEDTVWQNSFSVGANDSTITFTFGAVAAPATRKMRFMLK